MFNRDFARVKRGCLRKETGCVSAVGIATMPLETTLWSACMKSFLLTLFASALLMSGAYSRAAEYHMGEWIGTWQSGDNSGHFNLSLGRAADGNLVGNIDVSMDEGQGHEYAVDLRYVDFEGDRFTAVFLTPGKSAQVIKLTGTLDRVKGSGAWTARKRAGMPDAAEDAPASGTWMLQKQLSARAL
jgi:hypothetical protein